MPKFKFPLRLIIQDWQCHVTKNGEVTAKKGGERLQFQIGSVVALTAIGVRNRIIAELPKEMARRAGE